MHGESVEACTIVRTEANELVRPMHDRMPVILLPADFDIWIDPRTPKERLQALLQPYPAGEMTTDPVSTYVSNARNEGPRCLEA
jgi:putative SOS response-associated peptidase YedK